MAEEKDAFYVVKKGDVVGIYKSFADIQPLLASSVSGDSLSIHKGYYLPKKSEEYLVSHGLKGASYSVSASDVHEGLFGRLVACPFQQPCSSEGRALDVKYSSVRLQGAIQTTKVDGSSSFLTSSPRPVTIYVPQPEPSPCKSEKYLVSCELKGAPYYISAYDVHKELYGKLDSRPYQNVAGSSSFPIISPRPVTIYASRSEPLTCLTSLMFDGACKGNPGPAGAGAVLRAEDGSKVYLLREGVGIQTNNVAEYRALILGLKHAIKKGFKHIQVQGDSLLVCNQIQGLWKIKSPNMGYLCNEAKELKDKFLTFQINHVLREYNSEADAQANRAINLQAGQVEEDCVLP